MVRKHGKTSKSERTQVKKAPNKSHKKRSDFGGVQLVKAGSTKSVLRPTLCPQKHSNTKRKDIISSKIRRNDILSTSSKPQPHQPRKVNQEDIDFDQEYASLQERYHVNLWMKQTQPLVFEPPIFQLDKPPLSTEHLINSATDLVADGFKELTGASAQVYTPLKATVHTSDMFSSSTTTNLHSNATGIHRSKTHKYNSNQNYFGVLQSDDEDDDHMDKKVSSSLLFAKPTFHFQSNRFHEVDPDL